MRPRVIPVLLLENDGLVKTKKFSKPNYIGDPINAVKIYNDLEVDELVLIDRLASKNKSEPNFSLIKEIASESFIPMGYGGGITSIKHMEKLFFIGVEKVILNTALFENPNLIKEAVKEFGSQSIVGSIDINSKLFAKNKIYKHKDRSHANTDMLQFIKMAQDLGIGELMLQFVHKDGEMNGYDIELIKSISPKLNVPLIACSGAGKLTDFPAVINAGADAAAAGSMFVYTGKTNGILINYPEQNKLNEIFKHYERDLQ